MDAAFERLFIAVGRALKARGRLCLAIDGRSCAGKSTLAAALAREYGGNVIHMDDYFLPAQAKTPERMGETGGNIDYERFADEVIAHIFELMQLRRFDCHTQTLLQPRETWPKPLTVIEGVYSLHPRFGAYHDISCFLTVRSAQQSRRLSARDKSKAAMYENVWLPMEERYFKEFAVEDGCAFRFDTSDMSDMRVT